MAKAALTLDQVRNYCVFDGKPIPAERVKRNAVTCSKDCAKAIERQRMLLMEQSECKYCRRPSTPEERESYKQWRKWLKEQSTAKSTPEVTEESTEDEAARLAAVLREYPYIYKRFDNRRNGQRCKLLETGFHGVQVQIQFEDGGTMIADRMNISSGKPKKYTEKRGRPRKVGSTLAAKQEFEQGE